MAVNKRELFEKALEFEPIFEDYEMKDLSVMGDFLGRHPTLLKKIYKNFQQEDGVLTFESELGPPVIITLNKKLREIKISRTKQLEIIFPIDKFLRFIGLVDICYIEILPIGSVIELDLDFALDELKGIMGETSKAFNVMIIAQKVPLEENENIFADYAVTVWPFGLQKYASPFLITNLMVRNVVYRGMSNDTEKDYINKIKEKIVVHRMSSLVYMTKE